MKSNELEVENEWTMTISMRAIEWCMFGLKVVMSMELDDGIAAAEPGSE